MNQSIPVILKVALIVGITMLSTPALAYIDPGSGGFLLQAIIGAIAAGIVGMRKYLLSCIAAVQRFFAGRRRK